MAQKFETRCEKKPLFCLKFSPKNLYYTKNSHYEKPLFLKEPARGPAECTIERKFVLKYKLRVRF